MELIDGIAVFGDPIETSALDQIRPRLPKWTARESRVGSRATTCIVGSRSAPSCCVERCLKEGWTHGSGVAAAGSSQLTAASRLSGFDQRPRFVVRLPLSDEAGISSLDLVPRRPRHQLFKRRTHLAVVADPESLVRPRPAAGDARLKVVVARKAEDLKVRVAVVAALQHSQSMMHLEYSLSGRRSADLAGAAASGDQRPPARGRQRLDARAPVVGCEHPITRGAGPHQRGKVAITVSRALAAEDNQVCGVAARTFVNPEYVQAPKPLEAAPLACRCTPALKRNANARSKPQSPKHAFGPGNRSADLPGDAAYDA